MRFLQCSWLISVVNQIESHQKTYFSTYTALDNSGTDFANIQRIIVTSATLGIRVNEGRIFPSLGKTSIVEEDITFLELYQTRESQKDDWEIILQREIITGSIQVRIKLSLWLTSRSFPFFVSCLIGVNSSSVAISYFFLCWKRKSAGF